MTILWFIVALAAHFFIAFILMHCFDSAQIWKNDNEINLYKPSIYDLEDCDTEQMARIDNYVENVIKPAHHYFILRKRIEMCQENSGCSNELSGIILQLFSLFFVIKSAMKAFPNDKFFQLSDILYIIIIVAAALVICCSGCYITRRIYNKKFALENYQFNERELKQEFVYDADEYNISENRAFQNYVIMNHYRYLLFIESDVQFRYVIRRIILGISAILYFLFFFRADS